MPLKPQKTCRSSNAASSYGQSAMAAARFGLVCVTLAPGCRQTDRREFSSMATACTTWPETYGNGVVTGIGPIATSRPPAKRFVAIPGDRLGMRSFMRKTTPPLTYSDGETADREGTRPWVSMARANEERLDRTQHEQRLK